MHFYVIRVLLPGLLLDVLLTYGIFSFFQKNTALTNNKNALVAFISTPLYIITAFIVATIYASTDPRFQGQGVLGLFLFISIGIVCTLLRSLLGVILFMGLRHRE